MVQILGKSNKFSLSCALYIHSLDYELLLARNSPYKYTTFKKSELGARVTAHWTVGSKRRQTGCRGFLFENAS